MNGLKTFFTNMKYTTLVMFRAKASLFWTLVFPLVLATFMYASFGNLFEKDEIFSTIDVAVVDSKEDETLLGVLETLSENSSKDLLNIRELSDDEAKKALENEEVTGIIYTADASLVVNESSTKASILESILTEYKQQKSMYMDIAADHPEVLKSGTITAIETTPSYREVSTSDGNQSVYTNYFYAVFAMSCMFAAFSSLTSTDYMLANMSAVGMRRSLSALPKSILIISEYIMLLIIHFVIELIALAYMILLGVDFGTKYPAIILTLFVGCMIGLAIGVIIGCLPKLGEGAKIGISVGIGMLLSVMADLCANGIKDMVEHKLPILNRINPAVLITDCFYSLNIYSTYDRFFRNISIMAIESVVLLIIAFLLVRREKYASL